MKINTQFRIKLTLMAWSNTSTKLTAAAAKSLQSCPTLCDPIDGSPPGSPVPWILQARTLEWVAISFSNAWKWKVKVKSFPGTHGYNTSVNWYGNLMQIRKRYILQTDCRLLATRCTQIGYISLLNVGLGGLSCSACWAPSTCSPCDVDWRKKTHTQPKSWELCFIWQTKLRM